MSQTAASDATAIDVQAGRQRRRAGGVLHLGYAGCAYGLFTVVLFYTAGFLIDVGVPKGIDDGHGGPWPAALAVDAALLLLFAVQHTVMARPAFKRWLTRSVPAPAERATFVLAASLVLALTYWLWLPIPGTVWKLTGLASALVVACYAAGWAIAIGSTFLISHFDLFGLRQAYLHARGARYAPPPFTERGLYRFVRHPLMTGFLIIVWAAPTMSAGHLVFTLLATGYICIGIRFEEHDLRVSLGETYRHYLTQVPALVPGLPPAGRQRRPPRRRRGTVGGSG